VSRELLRAIQYQESSGRHSGVRRAFWSQEGILLSRGNSSIRRAFWYQEGIPISGGHSSMRRAFQCVERVI
jgi:hypothetical protein